MPIKVKVLQDLLEESKYDKKKSDEVVNGFKRGFDIGYRGKIDRKDLSDNIPLKVGSKSYGTKS